MGQKWNLSRVEYLAKLENVLEIPTKERLTQWYGDYGIYEPVLDVTMEQINTRIRELNKQIEHGDSCTVEIREILSRKITVENAKSIEDAVDVVMERYENGNIVLDADDFQSVEFDGFGM